MNETKNVSKRTRNPIFFRKDGGWKSVSTDCIVCMEACAYKCIFYMDDGTKKEVEMPLGTALAKTQEQATTFLRVHRSYAVNIEHIDMVYKAGQGTGPEVNLSPMIPDPNSHPRHYLFPLFVNIIWLY